MVLQAQCVARPLGRHSPHHGGSHAVPQALVALKQHDPKGRTSVWSPTAARRTLAGGLLGLALVAGDVFSPASLHLLHPLDAACHSWVIANVPAEGRATWAGVLLSDAPIVAGMAGWAYSVWAAHSVGWQQQQQHGEGQQRSASTATASQALVQAAAVYGLAGPYTLDDAPVVHLLKSSFQRARPSLIHFTYSFPSGHTTEAMVMSGVLLFLLLPVLQAELHRQGQAGQGAAAAAVVPTPPRRASSVLWTLNPSAMASSSAMSGTEMLPELAGRSPLAAAAESAGPGAEAAVPATWLDPLLRHRAAVWVGCGVLTASGRVLADAHWVSDTLAGACLGAALVSAAVLSWEALGGNGSYEQDD